MARAASAVGISLMASLATTALATSLNCWSAAATQYDLPVELLYAIAWVESRHNPDATAHAPDGTHSIGLMQVNSSWFPRLQELGVDPQSLRQPCTNIHVGAWILAQEVRSYGHSWKAIGAYYAGAYTKRTESKKLRHYRVYAARVLSAWRRIRQQARHRVDPQ